MSDVQGQTNNIHFEGGMAPTLSRPITNVV